MEIEVEVDPLIGGDRAPGDVVSEDPILHPRRERDPPCRGRSSSVSTGEMIPRDTKTPSAEKSLRLRSRSSSSRLAICSNLDHLERRLAFEQLGEDEVDDDERFLGVQMELP